MTPIASDSEKAEPERAALRKSRCARCRLVHFVLQNGKFTDLEKYDCVSDLTQCTLMQ